MPIPSLVLCSSLHNVAMVQCKHTTITIGSYFNMKKMLTRVSATVLALGLFFGTAIPVFALGSVIADRFHDRREDLLHCHCLPNGEGISCRRRKWQPSPVHCGTL